jgi:hypothetical protein
MAKLRSRLRSDAGMAVPSVLVLIGIGLAFAAAGAVAATTALRGSSRDHDSKAALAAADAGVNIALFRQNQVATSDSLFCVVESITQVLVAQGPLGNGWCAQQSGQVGNATYAYRTKVDPAVTVSVNGQPVTVTRRISVISTGTANGVTRRVKQTAIAPTGEALFGNAGTMGVDGVTIGGSADVSLQSGANLGGVGTNGDILVESSGLLCGSAMYGYGHGIQFEGSGSQCPAFQNSEAQFNLGAPVPPCSSLAVNDPQQATCDENSRIVNANTLGNDTLSPASALTNVNRFEFNASTRILALKSNTTLTVGGGTYRLCSLSMSGNSSLVIASQASTRIYILAPDDPLCGIDDGEPGDLGPAGDGAVTQVAMTGNTTIASTSNDPTDAAILMVGSENVPTTASLTGNARQNEFVLYAPRTDIVATGNSTYVGAMAGKTLSLSGSVHVEIPGTATDFDAEVLTRYERERFVECSATVPTGGLPDANC